jgi:hypothetical protein
VQSSTVTVIPGSIVQFYNGIIVAIWVNAN